MHWYYDTPENQLEVHMKPKNLRRWEEQILVNIYASPGPYVRML